MAVIEKPDIISVLEREGIELKRKGNSLWTTCPFHSEKTPSFKVDHERQTFRDAISYLGISPVKPSREAIQKAEREKHKQELVRDFKEWCVRYANDVYSLYQDIQDAKAMVKTMEDAEAIAGLYHMENTVLNESRIMDSNDEKAKFQLYMDIHGGKRE